MTMTIDQLLTNLNQFDKLFELIINSFDKNQTNNDNNIAQNTVFSDQDLDSKFILQLKNLQIIIKSIETKFEDLYSELIDADGENGVPDDFKQDFNKVTNLIGSQDTHNVSDLYHILSSLLNFQYPNPNGFSIQDSKLIYTYISEVDNGLKELINYVKQYSDQLSSI